MPPPAGDEIFQFTAEEHDIFTYERYSSDIFHGIMPDTGASGISTIGRGQTEALMKLDPRLSLERPDRVHQIKFGKGTASTENVLNVPTPFGTISFYVVPANTPALYCVTDMTKMGVKYDNLKDLLIQPRSGKIIPVVRKWDHPFLLLNSLEETLAYCHLTESQLKQIHRRFGHPSIARLTQVLERAGQDFSNIQVEKLTKFYTHC